MVYVKSEAKRSVHLYKAGFSDIVLQSSMERTEDMNGGETCWHGIPFIPDALQQTLNVFLAWMSPGGR